MPVKGKVKDKASLMKDTCGVCGLAAEVAMADDKPLNLHHNDGNRKNNAEENLQTLCPKCHTKWHWENGKTHEKGLSKEGRLERGKLIAAMGRIKIEYMKVSDLTIADYNPRTMADSERANLELVLAEFGFVENIVWNESTGNVVGGNQRLQSAIAMGLSEVPVVRVKMSLKKEKALNVALNKISGEWDFPLLGEALDGFSEEEIVLSGYNENQISEILEQIQSNNDDAADGDGFTQMTFRLPKDEADLVKGVLGDNPADKLIEICKEHVA